jgi:hypothetical protein
VGCVPRWTRRCGGGEENARHTGVNKSTCCFSTDEHALRGRCENSQGAPAGRKAAAGAAAGTEMEAVRCAPRAHFQKHHWRFFGFLVKKAMETSRVAQGTVE